MRTIDNVSDVLELYKRWVNGEADGRRADLYDADLSDANLRDAAY